MSLVIAMEAVKAMTELEVARAYLLSCQRRLATRRSAHCDRFGIPAAEVTMAGYDPFRSEKESIFAALSWVWDAQERNAETLDEASAGLYRKYWRGQATIQDLMMMPQRVAI